MPAAGSGALLVGRNEEDDLQKMERIEQQLRTVTAALWLDNLLVSRHHAEVFMQADQVCEGLSLSGGRQICSPFRYGVAGGTLNRERERSCLVESQSINRAVLGAPCGAC